MLRLGSRVVNPHRDLCRRRNVHSGASLSSLASRFELEQARVDTRTSRDIGETFLWIERLNENEAKKAREDIDADPIPAYGMGGIGDRSGLRLSALPALIRRSWDRTET